METQATEFKPGSTSLHPYDGSQKLQNIEKQQNMILYDLLNEAFTKFISKVWNVLIRIRPICHYKTVAITDFYDQKKSIFRGK